MIAERKKNAISNDILVHAHAYSFYFLIFIRYHILKKVQKYNDSVLASNCKDNPSVIYPSSSVYHQIIAEQEYKNQKMKEICI